MIFDPQAKLLWHGDRVREWLTRGRSAPVLVEIAPTGYCNASCSWCFFRQKRSTSRIKSTTMIEALQDMAKMGVKAVNWSGGGEPTLHPHFSMFVSCAAKHGIKQGLFTNGYNRIPYEHLFSWIRISITDEGFNAITKPEVPFGICVNHTKSHTRADLKHLCLQARAFGAYYFQVRPALAGSHRLQPDIKAPEYLKSYEGPDFKVYVTEYKYREAMNPKEYKACYGYHFCPSIDWNGRVSVCMYLTLDKKYNLGDLNRQSFSGVWASVPDGFPVSEGCQNCCKNHEINKILYAAKNAGSVDFI